MRSITRYTPLFSDTLIGLHEHRKVPPWSQLRTLQERPIDHEYSMRLGEVELHRQRDIARKIK